MEALSKKQENSEEKGQEKAELFAKFRSLTTGKREGRIKMIGYKGVSAKSYDTLDKY